ncbi:helix-turn-helix domain-containing protein [uncultured Sphaerochaeta sp.]|uniref:winged helix-turn-helix domain-containing protein n=1 Tax=uncultured Sphaerochaeta sp. TaxID=886478 RepID=UPI002A0A5FE2|nr:helix-turn-helix domain-containing protein [uncultured Sphaerochaeta sp.]
MKIIKLTTDEQLKIYMQPSRLKILHLLSVKGPMTPKMVADELEMTSSSAKHHLLKLVELEIVEIDHQETIHGILATYYKPAAVTVSLGLDKGGEREVLAQNLLRDIQDGFFKQAREHEWDPEHFSADMSTGVIHLSQKEADDLYKLIRKYLSVHEEKKEGTLPFVYSLVAYHG